MAADSSGRSAFPAAARVHRDAGRSAGRDRSADRLEGRRTPADLTSLIDTRSVGRHRGPTALESHRSPPYYQTDTRFEGESLTAFTERNRIVSTQLRNAPTSGTVASATQSRRAGIAGPSAGPRPMWIPLVTVDRNGRGYASTSGVKGKRDGGVFRRRSRDFVARDRSFRPSSVSSLRPRRLLRISVSDRPGFVSRFVYSGYRAGERRFTTGETTIRLNRLRTAVSGLSESDR